MPVFIKECCSLSTDADLNQRDWKVSCGYRNIALRKAFGGHLISRQNADFNSQIQHRLVCGHYFHGLPLCGCPASSGLLCRIIKTKQKKQKKQQPVVVSSIIRNLTWDFQQSLAGWRHTVTGDLTSQPDHGKPQLPQGPNMGPASSTTNRAFWIPPPQPSLPLIIDACFPK